MSNLQTPLVSIVMCTYNGEKYLKEQLDSLISQTYKNIEIVIVDDCSIDNTKSILTYYEKLYPFIRLFFNEVNLGFNKNFEKAILLTKGRYIAISDQDDIWDIEKIEILKSQIEDYGVIFSNSRLMNESNLLTGKFLLESPVSTDFSYKSILINNYVTGHTILAKTSFIKRTLPFPEQGYYDWWIGFIATYFNEITFLNKALTNYRVHSNSVIQKEVSSSNSDSLGISLINYKSCKVQLDNFYLFLKKNGEDTFIKTIISLYSEKTNSISRIFTFLFLHYHYNTLFPLEKRRKFISTTRFKIVKKYWKDILLCKRQVLGFI